MTLSTMHTKDGRVRVDISDTGEGIPPDAIDNIFEPFNRLNKAFSKIEGTGIGLTISKELVELMHGQIGVFNNPDSGITCWLELEHA